MGSWEGFVILALTFVVNLLVVVASVICLSKEPSRCHGIPLRCVEMKAGPRGTWTKEYKKKGKGDLEIRVTRRLTRGVPTTTYINKEITTGLTGNGLRAQLPTNALHTPLSWRFSSMGGKPSGVSKNGMCNITHAHDVFVQY